jgi:phosphoglycerol transferase
MSDARLSRAAVRLDEGLWTWTRWPTWFAYPGVAILSLVGVVLVMRLWEADLRLPLTYRAEAIFNAVLVKGVLEHGWHLSNPALSAPTGLDMRDLPMSDNNLHFAMIKGLGLLTPSYPLAMNLFFLSTFPLTALSALYVFRQFGLATWPSLCGSLLYTFLHFHFARGQHHLFLAAYYLVPLAVMVALWIITGSVSVTGEDGRGWEWRRDRPKLMASAIVCVLLGSSGVYYAYFACFFFLVAGAVAAVRQRRPRYLLLPVALGILTMVVLTAHFAPSLLHLYQHGSTPTAQRSPIEAETSGLRVSQLLMPITGHRLTALARAKDLDNARHQRLFYESADASLGVVGSVGFLALLAWLVVMTRGVPPRDEDRASRLLGSLSILNLSAVLLGTIGGFGAVVALVISAKIRAYNRISIFIAFFSLMAVVAGLDYLSRHLGERRGRLMAFAVGLAGLFALGMFDQTSKRAVPRYTDIAAEYRSDAAFVHRIQTALPPGAMIFQLPVIPFPEHPSVHEMYDYDHARGYLHASQLRWSYGAMKGRAAQAWQKWADAKPIPQLLETLAAADYRGLYVNRQGYADGAAALSAEIERVLGQPSLRSDNDRLLFYDLTAYQAELRGQTPPAAWEASREAALHPLLVIWQNGCSDLEGTAANNFRWCSAGGVWQLNNGARRAQRVTLQGSFVANRAGNLWIKGPLMSETLRIGPVPRAFAWTISVPPGQHALAFGCDAPQVPAVGDSRDLVFRIVNFRVISADP